MALLRFALVVLLGLAATAAQASTLAGPDSGWRDWWSGSTPDHNLGQENIYVLENDRDVVADLEYFGRDPSRDPDSYTHLSTQSSSWGAATSGHSSYLHDRTTSQHNIAQVVINGHDKVRR